MAKLKLRDLTKVIEDKKKALFFYESHNKLPDKRVNRIYFISERFGARYVRRRNISRRFFDIQKEIMTNNVKAC